MNLLILIFLASLTTGVLGGITIYPGVTFYIHDFVLVLLIIYTMFFQYHKIKFAKLNRPFIFFIWICIVSLVINAGQISISLLLNSSLYLLRFILYYFIYLTVLASPYSSLWWISGYFISGIIFIFFGYIQYFIWPDLRSLTILGWDPHYYRLTSTFLDPNFAGLYIVLFLLLGFQIFAKKRLKLILLSIFMIIALYLTHSRSSYMAFLGAFTVWAYLTRKYIIILGLMVLIIFLIILPKGRLDVTDLYRRDTAIARVVNWQKSVEFIKKSPLIGFGFNTLKYTGPFNQVKTDNIPLRSAGGIDNSFLVVLATTGIIGFLSLLWLIYTQIKIGLSTLNNKKYPGFGIVLISSLIALMIHCIFNNSLFYPWMMVFIWITTGVAEKETKEITIG
jgi:O-antigen ligase